jgi:hypothetical protein
MPVLTQLNLNVGTEQNPNMVLHDLHDIRISSTDVTTVTRLLGCNAGVNSIAPITLANAASLLGGVDASLYSKEYDLNEFPVSGIFFLAKAKCENSPSSANDGIFINRAGARVFQIWISTALGSSYGMFIRVKNTSWGTWYRFSLT